MTREESDKLCQENPEAIWKIITELASHVTQLSGQVTILQEKLAPKPHTPSSAQGFLKPNRSPKVGTFGPLVPMNMRTKTGKKTGGQEGHKGHTLEKNAHPDKIEIHAPNQCPNCGNSLKGLQSEVVAMRQVVDLPAVIEFVTTEHQVAQVVCPCCQHLAQGEFPEHATAPVVYGPHIQTTCVLLKLDQAIALERIVTMLTDWFHHSPSEGTIMNWIALASARLKSVEKQIAAGIIASANAGFDETKVRSCGGNQWIHVSRTKTLTHLSAPGGRGKVAMESAGILPYFQGVATHDAWGSYFSFTCAHSLCNAHLLREGSALSKLYQETAVWINPVLTWLLDVKKQVELGIYSTSEVLVAQLRALLKKGYTCLGLSPPEEGKKFSGCSKEYVSRVRYLDRLWTYASEVTRFGWDAHVPFDNNGSERDIRPVKLFSKVFGCWRSSSGLSDFCCVRGYLSTLRKQGISARAGLLSVFMGDPIMPATN
jgi:transposase